MRLSDVMSQEVRTVRPADSIARARAELSSIEEKSQSPR
jgi:hypothetical protein